METDEHLSRAPTLVEVQIALSNAEWLRYSSGGLIAGGGAVIIGILLGGVNLHRQSYVGFTIIYGGLMVANSWFTWCALLPSDPRHAKKTLIALIPGASVICFAIGIATAHVHSIKFPIEAFTINWWISVGLVFGIVRLGCLHRMRADRYLKRLRRHEKELTTGNTKPASGID
jgi:hypothetical protein